MALIRPRTKTLIEQAAGGRVELRHPRWADYDDWAELRKSNKDYLAPWEPDWSQAHLTRASFKTRLSAYDRMVSQGTGYPFHIFAGSSLRLVGACNISRIQQEPAKSCQLGYWVGQDHARQGFARAAVRAAMAFCFGDLGLHRIEAAVQPDNERSVALLQASDFTFEGTARGYLKINGRWRDHDIYARLSGD